MFKRNLVEKDRTKNRSLRQRETERVPSSHENPSKGSTMKRRVPCLVLAAVLLDSATILAQSTPPITIADFPRYSTQLNQGQREELRRVATGIAGVLLVGSSVDVSIAAHADFDAKGPAFETDVSRDRALGSEAALKALVQEEAAKVGLPAFRLAAVRYTSMGLGTAKPVFSPSVSEEQRRANRRVDFVLTATALQPQPQESTFRRCVRVLTGIGPAGPTRRMTCACQKLLQQSPRVQDSHYDFRARQRLPGLATLTPQQMAVAIQSIVLHMRQDISSA